MQVPGRSQVPRACGGNDVQHHRHGHRADGDLKPLAFGAGEVQLERRPLRPEPGHDVIPPVIGGFPGGGTGGPDGTGNDGADGIFDGDPCGPRPDAAAACAIPVPAAAIPCNCPKPAAASGGIPGGGFPAKASARCDAVDTIASWICPASRSKITAIRSVKASINASGTFSFGAAAICPNIVNKTAVIASCNGPNFHCGNAASAPKFSVTKGRIRS